MKRIALRNTKPKWTDTYIIHVGPRVLEIDRPTGAQRVIQSFPLKETRWEQDEHGRWWGMLPPGGK